MPITSYDPLVPPAPEEWLALEEGARIELVEDYHRKAGIRLPNVGFHATLQAVVETQIAMGDKTPVARTILRLTSEGLDRHEALHCVGKAFIETMNEAARDRTGRNTDEPYFRKIELLTAHSRLADAKPEPQPPRPRSRRRLPRQRFRP